MSRYIRNLGSIFLSLMVGILCACSDDVEMSGSIATTDENCIMLSLLTEEAALATRSEEISDGSLVNHLVYLIYEKDNENEDYKVSKFYHPDYSGDNKKPKVCSFDPAKRDNFAIKLLPDADAPSTRVYKIVCWAQYGDPVQGSDGKITFEDSPYYDLKDFPTIRVNYETKNNSLQKINYLNNDELRDAFYARKEFSVKDKGKIQKVVLSRPFAQINVGTSGWDYEGMASIEPDTKVVKYSTITITGVATTLDLFNDKTLDNNDNLVTVTFDYEVIPAYRNLNRDTELDEVLGVYADDIANIEADEEKGIKEKKGIYTRSGKFEEFLKIKFNDEEKPKLPTGVTDDWGKFDSDKDGYADYIGWSKYDQKCVSSNSHEELIYNIYTETFKYLSMCYVLVPFENGNVIGNTVEVEFDCAVTGPHGGIDASGIFGDEKSVLKLNNVPVAKNHRTNIIASDGSGFFMSSNELNVAVNYETFADYYKRLRALDDDWKDQEIGDENGEDLNDKFEWESDDIDSEAGKVPIIMANLYNPVKSRWIDVANCHVDVLKFMDDNVTFLIDPLAGFERYSGVTDTNDKKLKDKVSDYIREEDINYEFYLDDIKLPGPTDTQIKDGKYEFTFRVEQLNEIVRNKGIQSVVAQEFEEYEACTYNELDVLQTVKRDVPALKYYPIEFRVKTTFLKSNEKFVPEDYVMTIRLMSSYKFTFSEDSNDEGFDIWSDINKNGTLGSTTSVADDEKYFRFYDQGKTAISRHLEVSSRETPNNSNDKLFAFDDHLRFRGAGNDKGHWIILKNLRENCEVTVKIGRDAGQDNDKNGLEIHDRSLSYECNSTQDTFDHWLGWDQSKEDEKKHLDINSNNKGTYKNTETKIFPSKPEEKVNLIKIKNPGERVKLYINNVGHTFYWIILSEPGN